MGLTAGGAMRSRGRTVCEAPETWHVLMADHFNDDSDHGHSNGCVVIKQQHNAELCSCSLSDTEVCVGHRTESLSVWGQQS